MNADPHHMSQICLVTLNTLFLSCVYEILTVKKKKKRWNPYMLVLKRPSIWTWFTSLVYYWHTKRIKATSYTDVGFCCKPALCWWLRVSLLPDVPLPELRLYFCINKGGQQCSRYANIFHSATAKLLTFSQCASAAAVDSLLTLQLLLQCLNPGRAERNQLSACLGWRSVEEEGDSEGWRLGRSLVYCAVHWRRQRVFFHKESFTHLN